MTATNLKTGEVMGIYAQSWAMTILVVTGIPCAIGMICHALDADYKLDVNGREVYFRVVE